jgi:hypothetical protein
MRCFRDHRCWIGRILIEAFNSGQQRLVSAKGKASSRNDFYRRQITVNQRFGDDLTVIQ